MTHRLNLVLAMLALLVGLPYYVLLLANPSRDVAPHSLRVTDLRQLAQSVPGPRPVAIEGTVVAWGRTPTTLLAAGAGLKRRLYTVMSYRLAVPGGAPIVIDTGSAGAASSTWLETYLADRQRLVDADLAAARLVVTTSASPEALGGLARLGQRTAGHAISAKAVLGPAQVSAATRLGLKPGATLGPQPQAVAPGVVVIPAGAPTADAQMIYVQLGDGREYLFAGPVAPYAVNAAQLRTRSRLLDWWSGHEDRSGA
ncbi:MAG: hypothetical protein KGL54_14170, partial [Sphingomonadales bacterium]|nr:hypothetical protein [Sphingomonadales bacterium]